jgi:hypothetical protein
MPKICPNYKTCRLVNTNAVIESDSKREVAISNWCMDEETWKNCKRYLTRKSLWMCPDFVMPDSDMTEEEIIERCEVETDNK